MSLTRVAVVASFALLLACWLLFTLAVQAVRADGEWLYMRTSYYSWEQCRYNPNPSCPMANGQPFNPAAMTAAHRWLPFGTRVRVFHHDDRCWCRYVDVVIADRGPAAWTGKDLDLSEGAFRRLYPLGNEYQIFGSATLWTEIVR